MISIEDSLETKTLAVLIVQVIITSYSKGNPLKITEGFFNLTMHSRHFVYSYMASDIW